MVIEKKKQNRLIGEINQQKSQFENVATSAIRIEKQKVMKLLNDIDQEKGEIVNLKTSSHY